jgi:hypothetical protein
MAVSTKKLQKTVGREAVGVCLRKALRLADQHGVDDLRDWCRLELGGYVVSNPVMTDDIVVPEYRSVVGQHTDIYGRLLVVPEELSFVNETRLRNGVEELETLLASRNVVVIHDPQMCELIQEHLEVQVYAFRFSTVHLAGVLSAIGLELEDRLQAIDPQMITDWSSEPPKEDQILLLRPNLHGIGIDLRAHWRRWKGRDSSE